MNHLAVCDLQDSNSTSYICVTSVCQSKRPLWWSLVHWMVYPAVCNMMRGPPTVLVSILHQWKAVMCRTLTAHHIYVYPQYVSQSGPSDDLRCIEWTIWVLVIWWEVHQASWTVSYMNGKLWYVGCQWNIIYICNLSTSLKVAPPMISCALNGPSSCLWYNDGTTELPLEYLILLESCDMQLSNNESSAFLILVYWLNRFIQWYLVH